MTQQQKNIKKIKIKTKAYRSQCKSELPHHPAIETEDYEIKEQHCSCKAGLLHCQNNQEAKAACVYIQYTLSSHHTIEVLVYY